MCLQLRVLTEQNKRLQRSTCLPLPCPSMFAQDTQHVRTALFENMSSECLPAMRRGSKVMVALLDGQH